jgi:hypothetical protein
MADTTELYMKPPLSKHNMNNISEITEMGEGPQTVI